ncbi:penicillin amidase [Bosea sp. BE125]|uniref:penicillin acylase family protein n=1 Tax=Bosea sp. BE125 TaxID=2817909 RepID=UPI00285E6981|nr:penicillin acylase family protein [Bosea sp. BE125]MDR6870841.1 penicillin amidase [Bosea sp. BE125]
MTTAADRDALEAALPPLSGTLSLPGLEAPVSVRRDAWGIPHIKAVGEADAYRALGFVHAQDRLFQMELTRRRALGRAAEWLGAEAAEADILVRRLGMEQACRRDYDALAGETKAMLQAYAAGVNAFLESGAPVPCEYTLLGATPERWEPWHSIAVMRRLGLLMGSIWFKLWRMLALPVVGAENALKLRYDDGGRDLLCIPPGGQAERFEADLAALGPAVDALLKAMGGDASDAAGGGSNNWAVGPERTATGRPILAGDPHRVFEIPGMYTQHHLACDRFDMIGLTVPGVPGFPHFAHNGSVAYCVTHAFMDIHDLYLEQFTDAGRAVRFGEGFELVSHRRDRIAVRGGVDREFDIFETRHGPVIAGDPRAGAGLSLRSVQFAETDLSFDCLTRMPAASTVPELYEATRGWGLIDHNLVAGDTAGTIGHLVRARVPLRSRDNGWLPVPGWAAQHEWRGWIAHDAMPCVIDPPGGLIVTANNRVVADDHPDYLCTDCHPPYRAERILQRLDSGAPFAVADAAAIHADTQSPHLELFRTRLAALGQREQADAEQLRQDLLAWNGHMDAESAPAAAYNAFRRALTRIVTVRSRLEQATAHRFAAVAPGVSPQGQVWWAVPTLLRDDDAGMLNGLTWDDVLSEALSEAAATLTGKTWGEEHQPRFAHPLSAQFPDWAQRLDPPSLPVGGDGDTVLAIGIVPSAGPVATYGALSRYVFDVGNWDNSRWVVFHGTSGHPASPHYADQNTPWSACEMVPMLYDWERIAVEAQTRQELVPPRA